MVAKGISQDDFLENGVGRWSNRSFRMRTMTVSGSSPTHSPRRVVSYFYRNSVVYFREQQVLFLKWCFLIHGLGKCEGVGEDSRDGIGHLDIQVGSRIYLSVCLHWIIAYALRCVATHLG